MHKEPKIAISSLIAPLASLLVPAVLAIFTLMTESRIQNDDAAVRAAGLLLTVVLPVAYSILAVFMAAVGYVLDKVCRLTFTNLLVVYGGACLPVAVGFGWSSPFGLIDRIIGLAVFLPLTVLCTAMGAVCWWFLAVGHSPSFKRGRKSNTIFER